jgi:hypothetical protein
MQIACALGWLALHIFILSKLVSRAEQGRSVPSGPQISGRATHATTLWP